MIVILAIHRPNRSRKTYGWSVSRIFSFQIWILFLLSFDFPFVIAYPSLHRSQLFRAIIWWPYQIVNRSFYLSLYVCLFVVIFIFSNHRTVLWMVCPCRMQAILTNIREPCIPPLFRASFLVIIPKQEWKRRQETSLTMIARSSWTPHKWFNKYDDYLILFMVRFKMREEGKRKTHSSVVWRIIWVYLLCCTRESERRTNESTCDIGRMY